jgi:hypothetical protein
MILGSTIVELKPGNWNTCALGVAATAIGIPGDGLLRVPRIRSEWPWLNADSDGPMREICSLFDQRVCRGDMSFDQLVEFVRQIEPPCECGVRSCVCARIEGLLPASVEVVAEEFEPAF